jgi:hypothetical protein
MSTTTKLAVTGGAALAACAACCAASIVPVAAGASLAAVGGGALWGALGLLIAVPVAGVVYMSLRTPKAPAKTFQALLAASDGCGCGDSCGSKSPKDDAPIACTLEAGDFKTRTAGIRALAGRSLLNAKRTPLSLALVYGPEALAEVQELVRKEQDCCAFLDFALTHDAAGVHLTIAAPATAADAADMLFDHFAPDLARDNRVKEPAE